jgi:thymidylate kinase
VRCARYGSEPAVEVVTIIEATAASRVLIAGSPPPAGRDYDLLATEADRLAIASALEAEGFQLVRDHWVRFEPGAATAVDLMTPADWGLADDEADALFTWALPFEGCARLCLPDPAHQLLILARKLPRTPGVLKPGHRQRIQAALARDPNAWVQARARAGDWGVERRLRRLQSRSTRPPRTRWPPRYVRRPRRGAVVALSGLDGVGKSTQAQMLCASLTKLGYEADVVWDPIGSTDSLTRFASAAKRGLAQLPFGPLAHADRETVERRRLSQTGDARDTGLARRLFSMVWSTVVTLESATSCRRAARGTRIGGRIVIFDRYLLDTIVHLRFSYAPRGRLPLQETIARVLMPAPRCAFLLDASPKTAHARKPDWSLEQTSVRADLYRREYRRMGVQRLDAEQPANELASQIGRRVLEAIAS